MTASDLKAAQRDDGEWAAMSLLVQGLEADLQAAREALRFYADEKSWNPEPKIVQLADDGMAHPVPDRGLVARAALSSGEDQT